MQKLLIIGIDGADHEYVSEQLAQGRLPALRALADEGAFGLLRSTCPPVSCPAWPAMTTGLTPGDLGVFDFTLPDGYEKRLVSGADILAPRLWDYVGANGSQSVIVNVPVTYPPRAIDGVMVTGFLSPPDGTFAFPAEVGDELRARFGYAPGHAVSRKGQIDCIRKRRDALLHLLRRQDWGLAMIVFGATDWSQHRYWEDRAFIDRVFAEVDDAVAMIVREAGADNAIVVSDHGFIGADAILNVNRLLAEAGLLAYGKAGVDSYSPMAAMIDRQEKRSWLGSLLGKVVRPRPVLKAMHFLHLEWTLNLVPAWLWRSMKKRLPVWSTPIDWSRTKAYLYNGNPQTVRLNLAGRDPLGIVSEEEYEAVRAEVCWVLEEAVDPLDGRPVCRAVRKREDAFAGQHMELAPDLVFEVTDDRYVVSPADHPQVVWRTGKARGRHRYGGIYIARGPAFRPQAGPELDLVQMMPTMLHAMGLAVPTDQAGRVALELFPDGRRSVETADYDIRIDSRGPAGGAAQESADVVDRLRDLGYL